MAKGTNPAAKATLELPLNDERLRCGDIRADGYRWWSDGWLSPDTYRRSRAVNLIGGRRKTAKIDKGECGRRGPAYQRARGSFREDGYRWCGGHWLSPDAYRRNRSRSLISDRRRSAMRKRLDVSGLDSKGPHWKELIEIIAFGKSILSGIPFNHEGGRTWDSPSIDRKDARKGYEWDNIRVVLDAENSAMGTWGKERTMYLFSKCLLYQAAKRGAADVVLAVLQAEANYWEGQCQSMSTSAASAEQKKSAS